MCAWCEGGKGEGEVGVGGSVFLRFLSAPPNLRRSHGTPNAVRGGRLRSRTVLCPFCHKDRRVVGRAVRGEGGVGVLERAWKSGEGCGGDSKAVQQEGRVGSGKRRQERKKEVRGYSLRYSRAEKHASAVLGHQWETP